MIGFKRFLRSWRDARQFHGLPPRDREIVFYSEGADYWVFFESVVDSLVHRHGRTICYLTSDPHDPVLHLTDPKVRAFYIGDGSAMIFLFQGLQAGLMITTMPDLGAFHIKRSRYPVHYAYLHHSAVSTHMIYRKGAFDQFDSILCAGPHHMEETRQWERLNGLPAKQLFAHGYGPLDALLKAAAERPAPPRTGEGGLRVLVAPSWGPDGLLETCGKELIEILLAADHHVTARPHPRTRQLRPQVLEDLGARFGEYSGFKLDEDWSSQEPLLDAHIMISDWSGVAMEFAFGLERPVLFVDVPHKVNNPEYTRLNAVPLEVAIREEIGSVLPVGRLGEAPAVVAALCRDSEAISERARIHRNKWIYNAGKSGIHGAEIIVELAQRCKFVAPR